MADLRLLPLTRHFGAYGCCDLTSTVKGVPGRISSPNEETTTPKSPDMGGIHTHAYVPSPLSLTRQRTCAGPRIVTKKASPPLPIRAPV